MSYGGEQAPLNTRNRSETLLYIRGTKHYLAFSFAFDSEEGNAEDRVQEGKSNWQFVFIYVDLNAILVHGAWRWWEEDGEGAGTACASGPA